MYSAWTKHLSEPAEKERFEKGIWGSRPILDRLKDIVDEDLAALTFTENTYKDFDNPSWAYKQAFRNGFRSAMSKVIKLVDLSQQIPTTEKNT